MRTPIFLFLLLLSSSAFSQKIGWQDLATVKAPENYENTHYQKLFGDSLSSSSVIFIKKEIKMHLHESHSEHVYVIEGTADMLLGGMRLTLSPGQVIFIPKGTPHAVYVSSSTPLKVLSIQSPFFDGIDRVMLEE